MSDARFEDGVDKPLRLIAFEVDDLQVISAMAQDAVFPVFEMTWRPKKRRFALLLQVGSRAPVTRQNRRLRTPASRERIDGFCDEVGAKIFLSACPSSLQCRGR